MSSTLVLGTAGHIDHGKTWLVRALTGKDTDRLPEERERGISIDLGYAPAEGEERYWAEARIVEFCRERSSILASGHAMPGPAGSS